MRATRLRRFLSVLWVCGLATGLAHVARAQPSPQSTAPAGNPLQTRAPEAAGTSANQQIERARPANEHKVETPAINPSNSAARTGQRNAMAGPAGRSSHSSYGRLAGARASLSKPGINAATRGPVTGNYARARPLAGPGVATSAAPTSNVRGSFGAVPVKRYSTIAPATSLVSAASKSPTGYGVLGGPAVPDRGKLGGPAGIRDATKAGINGSSQRRHF